MTRRARETFAVPEEWTTTTTTTLGSSDGSPEDVLTPDLIRAVFRMDAVVSTAPDGALAIRYLAPL